jgi:hypothetical protein
MKEHRMKYIVIVIVMLVAWPLAAQQKKSAQTPPQNTTAVAVDPAYKEMAWDDLVPKNWDPAKRFKNMDLSALQDGDPKAMQLLDTIKQEWDNAPIDPSLNGRKIRIPGFVVPIEEHARAVTEFLLVPYFGACIHVPPPPANQIIHVVTKKPIKNLHVMDAVWVAGELKAARYTKQTPMGVGAAGYEIESVTVLPYKEPTRTVGPSR